jgi:hypothetical protein
MKFTKGWKIVLGIFTVGTAFWPFVYTAGMMVILMLKMPVFLEASSGGFRDTDRLMLEFFRMMAVLYPFVFCGTILQLALTAFFMVLAVTNKALTDTIRILMVLALFFMPFIGLPFYYFAYILPQQGEAAEVAPVKT